MFISGCCTRWTPPLATWWFRLAPPIVEAAMLSHHIWTQRLWRASLSWLARSEWRQRLTAANCCRNGSAYQQFSLSSKTQRRVIRNEFVWITWLLSDWRCWPGASHPALSAEVNVQTLPTETLRSVWTSCVTGESTICCKFHGLNSFYIIYGPVAPGSGSLASVSGPRAAVATT